MKHNKQHKNNNTSLLGAEPNVQTEVPRDKVPDCKSSKKSYLEELTDMILEARLPSKARLAHMPKSEGGLNEMNEMIEYEKIYQEDLKDISVSINFSFKYYEYDVDGDGEDDGEEDDGEINLYLQIVHKDIWEECDDEGVTDLELYLRTIKIKGLKLLSEDEQKKVLAEKLKEIMCITNLYFDKYDGVFRSRKSDRSIVENCFNEINKIEKSKCPVCYEDCRKKLLCDHILCVECYQNMLKERNKDLHNGDKYKEICCPLCREDVTYIHLNTSNTTELTVIDLSKQ